MREENREVGRGGGVGTRRLAGRLSIFLCVAVSTAASVALAQPPRSGQVPLHASATATPLAAPVPGLVLDAGATAADAGVVVVQKYDGGQTFKFGEVDIEGRLKSPTLVYFLRRVRAEFAAGDLGHRSFLRELSQTRNGQSF